MRRVAISVDGPSAEAHDAFRGFRASFQIARGIARDVVAVGLSLQIKTTISRYNLRLVGKMTQTVADLGAVRWSLFFLVPTGRGRPPT